jgi:extracellular elastinolytic metalloproteinase
MPGLSENFESGTLGKFASAVATCVPGGCGWSAASTASHGGTFSAYAPDVNNVSNQRLQLVSAFAIPASGVTGAHLTFWHRYSFEGSGTSNYDGGVLEISTDGGGVWVDVGSHLTGGGYNGGISSAFSNPLAGRSAWVQANPGYPAFYQSTVDLLTYAGKNVLIRFREGDDNSNGATGWWIDDLQVTMNGCFHQHLPIVTKENATNQQSSSTNPLLDWLQSLWNR